jgi:hypothetical protein
MSQGALQQEQLEQQQEQRQGHQGLQEDALVHDRLKAKFQVRATHVSRS